MRYEVQVDCTYINPDVSGVEVFNEVSVFQMHGRAVLGVGKDVLLEMCPHFNTTMLVIQIEHLLFVAGLSDPFVEMSLHPYSLFTDKQLKTSTKKQTLDPLYNEEFLL